MRRVFLSFLGLGTRKGDSYDYDFARYAMDGKESRRTKFVQAAEVELLGPEFFNLVLIVTTEKSQSLHFDSLKSELLDLGARHIVCLPLEEDMTEAGQWRWFEAILEHIQTEDQLSVDITHGYRAIPIVFSNSIHFLQKAKRVNVEHVFYGAYEKNRELTPVVDMKNFFIINEWAEGVSRLVEDADAGKVARQAKATPSFRLGELNDAELLHSLQNVTNRIRNVDMHNVHSAARTVVNLISERFPHASAAGQELLGLLTDKFETLAKEEFATHRYDRAYFLGQLAFIRMLLDHKLSMQAFTAMRETIASIGLIHNEKASTDTARGRDERSKAEVFVNMFQFEPSKWRFSEHQKRMMEGLMPLYSELEKTGIEREIRALLPALVDYRNGFDHGWTKKSQSAQDIDSKGDEFFLLLKKIVDLLDSKGLFR